MSRMTYATVVAALLLLTLACSPTAADRNSPATPSMAPASPVLGTAVEQECGLAVPPGVAVSEPTVRTEDGLLLRTAVFGTGTRGVAMLHQTDNGLCGWFSYAAYLATQGFHVAIFDRRCTFGSDCTDEPAAHDFVADIRAVLATLRDRGATTTALVGASFGGAVAIGACAVIKTPACVALSPAVLDSFLDDETTAGEALTANNAIGRIRTPLLVAVAPDDPDSPAADVAALAARAHSDAVTLVRLPANAGHGWDTVSDPVEPGRPTPFSARVVAFLDRHLQP